MHNDILLLQMQFLLYLLVVGIYTWQVLPLVNQDDTQLLQERFNIKLQDINFIMTTSNFIMKKLCFKRGDNLFQRVSIYTK